MIKEEEISRSQRIYIRALDRSIADVKKVILKKKKKKKGEKMFPSRLPLHIHHWLRKTLPSLPND